MTVSKFEVGLWKKSKAFSIKAETEKGQLVTVFDASEEGFNEWLFEEFEVFFDGVESIPVEFDENEEKKIIRFEYDDDPIELYTEFIRIWSEAEIEDEVFRRLSKFIEY